MPSRPIAQGLFTWPLPDSERAALLGSRCEDCSAWTFPVAEGCPSCGGERLSVVELARRGTLYTWTTQEFLPKDPYLGPETAQDFEPWAIGYVELPGQLRVESRLYDVDPQRLDFDQPFELVVRLFTQDPDGTDVYAFGFRPASEEMSHA